MLKGEDVKMLNADDEAFSSEPGSDTMHVEFSKNLSLINFHFCKSLPLNTKPAIMRSLYISLTSTTEYKNTSNEIQDYENTRSIQKIQ